MKTKPVNLQSFKERIRKNILMALSKAPFPVDSKQLRGDAVACSDCPERTGANVLFAELAEDDLCLNKVCFEAKTRNFVQIERRGVALAVLIEKARNRYRAQIGKAAEAAEAVKTDSHKHQAAAHKTSVLKGQLGEIEKFGTQSPFAGAGETEIAKATEKVVMLTGSYYDAEGGVLTADKYHPITTKGDNCAFSETGVYAKGEQLGKRQLICRRQDCEKHFRSSSSSSSLRTPPTTDERLARKNELFEIRADNITRLKVLEATSAEIKPSEFWTNPLFQRLICAVLIELTGGSSTSHLLEQTAELLGIKRDELTPDTRTYQTDADVLCIYDKMAERDDASYEISQNLPGEVIKLAELFWLYTPAEDEDEDEYRYSKMTEVEDYFCISTNSTEYFPASAFQTPIFQLLKFAPRAAIDFILSFTNKTVECYANSKLKYEVEKIKVFVDEETVEQYISHRLWNTYRGTQVSTSLLASIHMALEKFLLDFGKIATKENLESWCKYLIKNSKSSSITAIVASLVLAYPEKLFDIATILFRTKEFFLYDTARTMHDQTSKGLYSIGYGLNYKNKIYEDERLKTCDDAHRKLSLEHIALNYQFLKSKDNLDFDKQSEVLWAIWDNYYSALPPKSEQSENDKTWRLYLARMDTRKMSPTYEKEENGDRILVTFNPELDVELKKHSEEALQMLSASMKYTPLQLWANSRFRKERESYEKYPQYENDPHLALSETKEVIKEIRENTENALPFNRPTPALCCAVLFRDFYDELNSEEKEFCRDIITEFASLPLHNNDYENHIFDGAEPAIKSLSLLIKHFPQNKGDIKLLLFLLLLNHSKKISIFATESILFDLWDSNFEDAQSIFVGFLKLKPKYDELAKKIIEQRYANNIFFSSKVSNTELIPQFIQEYEIELEPIIQNKISFQDLGTLQNLNFRTLITAFELSPLGTTSESHKKFVTVISSIFANNERMKTEDEKNGFTLKRRIQKKFAFFVLSSTKDEVKSYVQPFIKNFEITDNAADFFSDFVSAEDDLNQYENFWITWDLFYEKIVEMCRKSSSYHYTKPILHNYLLAWQWWREDARTWRSLRDREKLFFRKVAQDIGHYAPVLYSLSKFLNQIGSEFLDDGIIWIGGILEKNKGSIIGELEAETLFYLDKMVKRYFLKNSQKVKANPQIKRHFLNILNFLVEKGSVEGYLIREAVL